MKMTSSVRTNFYRKRRVISLKYAPFLNQQNNRLTMNYMAIETHFVASLSYWIDYIWSHQKDVSLKE